ncbi:MAG: molybdate ABC transporter substrate-binding protein, partial [Hyphomicrobium sp.]
PDLAPYGRAAREVMQKTGLWAMLQSRLALAENIAQAAQFVASGAADVGFIAKSSAVSAELRDVLRWTAVRDDWYQPIDQRMAVLKSASAGGRAFAAFLGGPEARVVLERSGFRVP